MNKASPVTDQRRRHLVPLAEPVHDLASAAFGKEWARYARLLEHWDDILGPELASHTTPVQLRMGKAPGQGGALRVRVPAPLAPDIQALTPQILERINSYFGKDSISRLLIEHASPMPGKTLEPRNDHR
ncbi:MAG: DUF721 domain-containing protein [Alphaproteobacteria bacterium]|nr:MAG: DUF721 domain-containing protein [Alphaproteobacteria bacterium]